MHEPHRGLSDVYLPACGRLARNLSQNLRRDLLLDLVDAVDAQTETHRIPLREQTDQVRHAYLPEVLPGQLYGYRVHGAVASDLLLSRRGVGRVYVRQIR